MIKDGSKAPLRIVPGSYFDLNFQAGMSKALKNSEIPQNRLKILKVK